LEDNNRRNGVEKVERENLKCLLIRGVGENGREVIVSQYGFL
jgi:hypothetical protein